MKLLNENRELKKENTTLKQENKKLKQERKKDALLEENQKLEKIKEEYETFKKTTFKKIMEENNRLKTKCQLLIDNHNNNTNFI